MPRKSALTAKQWKDIETRFYNGESASALAREYKISEAAIRKRFGAKRCEAKELANHIVAVELKIKGTNESTKLLARTFADRILALQNLAGDAAANGLAISNRVSEVSKRKVLELSDNELMDAETLKGIMAAGVVANTHARIGLDLLALAAREKKEPEVIASEEPVKFYLPQNGR
ncbi:MAG: hypothetical protein ABL856_03805 [Gallionella sp.]